MRTGTERPAIGRLGPAVNVSGNVSSDVSIYVAAGLSLAAALIHLWATPEHLEGWWAYGAFFVLVALAQGFFAVLLLRWPTQLLFFLGIAGNLAIVFMYLVSRTRGVPLGPHAGEAEEAGLLDMSATTAELGVVVLMVALLKSGYRTRMVNALLFLGAAIWALRLLGILA